MPRVHLALQVSLLCSVLGLPNRVRADAPPDGNDAVELSAEADSDDPSESEPSSSGRALDCKVGDIDGDGLCDEVEAATGTWPLRADTDADGLPDGVEDKNRDGVLDPGETDPRVPGLFPGGYPHIPEPMVFDLVRGLGAKKGEVEVNTLAVLTLRRQERALLWAPEVEWAIADGVALELELPMHDRQLEALKAAFQVTLPMARRHITHGAQVIGEYAIDARDWRTTALYLVGGRLGKWSLLAMVGARAVTPPQTRASYEALINPGVYHDVTETLTWGVEGNVALGFGGSNALAAIPQVHWQITRNVRVQVGGGVGFHAGNPNPLLATRIVLE